MNWYLKKAGSETIYGPVDEKSLEAWAADGRISPFDLISPDQQEWKPAPQADALKMEWTVEFDDGRRFGPLHALAFRELVRAGEINPGEKARSAKSGQTATIAEVLLPYLLGTPGTAAEGDEALRGQFEMARRAADDLVAKARQAEAALQDARDQLARTAQEKEEALRRAAQAEAAARETAQVREQAAQAADRSALERQVSELQEQLTRAAREAAGLTSAREEALKALEAARREGAQTTAEINSLREQLAKAGKEKPAKPAPSDKELADARATFQRQALELQAATAQLAAARAEIEKWKKQATPAQAAMVEKARPAPAASPAQASDMVPRAQLEEAQRRIAHLERSYRQALSSMHRNLAARSGESQATPPEQLRRRDIA